MARPPKSEIKGYDISIVGKNLEVTDAIWNYVFSKLGKIEHFADHVIDIVVTLYCQKLEYSCSMLMNFNHFHIKVTADTDNLYSSIDKASDRMIKLVLRYKSKLQSTRDKHLSTVDIHVNVIKPLEDNLAAINDEILAENAHEEEDRYKLHEIVAKETVSIKTLTEGEAVMKMELSEEPFLLYRSEEDQKMKMIYRRGDDNYSLIQIP